MNAKHGEADSPVPQARPFSIVGIGASAGGLDAISRLLRELPADTGMAFVVVLHLDPTYDSQLDQILARTTTMPVHRADDGQAIEPDHVYVIPPGRDLAVSGGKLHLGARSMTRGQHFSIDMLFESLAADCGHSCIGVILSGASTDGTHGLAEVKSAGGITFAQDSSAQHDTMPRSAIAAGSADLVLAPEEIAREIARIARFPLVAASAKDHADEMPAALFMRVIDILRRTTDVDFSNYKRSTLQRRITRRMVLLKMENLPAYLEYLRQTPAEVEALQQDILINVTCFFRDPVAWDVLKKSVFPHLLDLRGRGDKVRAWVLGCSSGEEAYSLAIAWTEFLKESGHDVPLHVFATDINARVIDKARNATYPASIARDVSPERLAQFFVESDGRYRIAKPIRDMCVFAQQNVLVDPPFSHIDLVVCRNMLIYFDPLLQKKVLPMLHYSLRTDGVLWLGISETIGAHADLFEATDARNRVYARKPGANPAHLHALGRRPEAGIAQRIVAREKNLADRHREADRLLLARYAPAAVVLNADLDIVQYRGDTSRYLAPAPGRASHNILRMLREGLLVGVRSALQRVRREQLTLRVENLRVQSADGHGDVNVILIPLREANSAGEAYLLVFEEPQQSAQVLARELEARARELAGQANAGGDENDISQENARLTQELASMREHLHSVIEQQEASNEELQAANEEVQSANEELQSINEELETSKEEIQSSNEELATVNDELQRRNEELARSTEDLTNLLGSVQLAIVMLGADLGVRRFTPAAETMFNLVAADVGRPLTDIRLNVDVPDIQMLLRGAVDEGAAHDREVRDRNGRWYLLRIRPYTSTQGRNDGAAVILIDIDRLKRAEEATRESEARFALLAEYAPVLIWSSDPDGCEFVNGAYLAFVGTDEAHLRGSGWLQFVHDADRQATRECFMSAATEHAPFKATFRLRRHDGQYRWTRSVGIPRFGAQQQFLGHVGSTFDVTDFKDAEQTLREADRSKDDFLALLAHELRNPLAAIRSAEQILSNPRSRDDQRARAMTIMERQTLLMMRVIDDLLDLSRLTHGKIELRREPLDLRSVVDDVVAATDHQRASAHQQLDVALPQEHVLLNADRARLDQIFANLLNNASKFTLEGGTIRFELHLEGSPSGGAAHCVVANVSDNGIGIDALMLDKIFEPFTQADRSIERTRSGMGMGLALARQLVQLHGGSIAAFSDGIGRGARFEVRLPLPAAQMPVS